MLIIRGGINSKKRELCPTALALSAFYYNKNKHADTYIMYLHAYSTRDTRKSAHCLWLVGHTPGESKRGRDTESDAVIRLEEIHTFFSNECFICSSIRNLYQVLFIILLIAKGAGHGKRQLHKIQLVYMTIQVVRWKRYR